MPSTKSAFLKTMTGTYAPPTLTIYGEVGYLTASGTGTPAEGSSPGNPGQCTPQTDRNRC